jgi:hypothetical protein
MSGQRNRKKKHPSAYHKKKPLLQCLGRWRRAKKYHRSPQKSWHPLGERPYGFFGTSHIRALNGTKKNRDSESIMEDMPHVGTSKRGAPGGTAAAEKKRHRR